jgi:hypothetical protein
MSEALKIALVILACMVVLVCLAAAFVIAV